MWKEMGVMNLVVALTDATRLSAAPGYVQPAQNRSLESLALLGNASSDLAVGEALGLEDLYHRLRVLSLDLQAPAIRDTAPPGNGIFERLQEGLLVLYRQQL